MFNTMKPPTTKRRSIRVQKNSPVSSSYIFSQVRRRSIPYNASLTNLNPLLSVLLDGWA